jgi:hypothetical protein
MQREFVKFHKKINTSEDLFAEMDSKLAFPFQKLQWGTNLNRGQELFGNSDFKFPYAPKCQPFTQDGIAFKMLKLLLKKDEEITVEYANVHYSMLIQKYKKKSKIGWHTDKVEKLDPTSDVLSASFYAKGDYVPEELHFGRNKDLEKSVMMKKTPKSVVIHKQTLLNCEVLSLPVESMKEFCHCTAQKSLNERINVTLRKMNLNKKILK